MRVITGDAKGHRLKSRPGLSTRPTTDLVRGAIFSILGTTAKKWALVLDLYAGTGALGIEALSEGASRADFVERNAKCCDIIRHNLKATGLTNIRLGNVGVFAPSEEDQQYLLDSVEKGAF